MKPTAKLFFIIYHLLFIISASANDLSYDGGPFTEATQRSGKVLDQIIKVNNYWQAHNTPYVRSFWDHAAYHTGNMALYFLTGDEKYRNYSETWAKRWKYEGYPDYEKTGMWEGNFADNHAAFQTFFDLYKIEPAEEKIKVAKYVMERQLNDKSPEADRWWWWIDEDEYE